MRIMEFMKKNKKVISMTLIIGTLSSTSVTTALATNTSKIKSTPIQISSEHLNLSQETINSDLNEFCENLLKEVNKYENPQYRERRSVASKGVKYAAKWLRVNWKIIVRKSPKWIRPYLQATVIGEVIDAYVGISDSVEEFIYNVLRDILPKNVVNDWWVDKLTTTIMLLMPI